MALRHVAALSSALTLASASSEGPRDYTNYSWDDYLTEFEKSVANGVAETARFVTWKANMENIQAHNTEFGNGKETWWMAVNEFTDWTNAEFRAQRTGHSPHPQENVIELTAPLGDLPDTVDWREKKGVVTKVKNQGGCGSCWAFSATETLESHLAIATSEPAPILSPQQIVSCAPNPQQCGGTGGCEGSTQPLAFNYTKGAGMTLESSYPYQGSDGTCDESKIAPVGHNDGYVQLKTNDYTALVTAVATTGPIAISVAAGGLGWQLYGGGVYSDSGRIHPFMCTMDMDHAVQLVGYGTDKGKMYWLVRNSWGSWGEKGYIRIERHGEGKEPCGTDKTPQHGDACSGDTKPRTYCGLCGILSSSSYPTGLTKTGSVTV